MRFASYVPWKPNSLGSMLVGSVWTTGISVAATLRRMRVEISLVSALRRPRLEASRGAGGNLPVLAERSCACLAFCSESGFLGPVTITLGAGPFAA